VNPPRVVAQRNRPARRLPFYESARREFTHSGNADQSHRIDHGPTVLCLASRLGRALATEMRIGLRPTIRDEAQAELILVGAERK
jgi:hypothetical protein